LEKKTRGRSKMKVQTSFQCTFQSIIKEVLDKKSNVVKLVIGKETRGRSKVIVQTLSECFSQSIFFFKEPLEKGGVECPKKTGRFIWEVLSE